MKVKTLIKKLEKMNQEAVVRLNDYNCDVVLFANARKNDNTIVWFYGEGDIDMHSEICDRYERAEEEQVDELDFYIELLEIGITVDMVRKYMGEDHANKMNEFCEEHGLI